jgi:hypothetical protein
MAVDRGYGSGKSRSAANSAARRTKAASANLRKKNIKKVASKPFQKQLLASVGKQAAAGFNIGGRQYLETGVSGNKLSQFFSGMSKSKDLNWGPSVTFQNPFKKALNAPKPPKELDWGPRALFVRTKPTKPKGELDWGKSWTVTNPFKRRAK